MNIKYTKQPHFEINITDNDYFQFSKWDSLCWLSNRWIIQWRIHDTDSGFIAIFFLIFNSECKVKYDFMVLDIWLLNRFPIHKLQHFCL